MNPNRPAVFLDMDETLVHVGQRTFTRPGAEEFLEELRGFADIYIYTAAEPWYMVEVLQTTGLDQFFDDFYSLQEDNDFDSLRLNERDWLLVDNLGYDRHLVHAKLTATGVPFDEGNFLQVEEFTGDSTDTVLLDSDLMQDIKRKLQQPTGDCYQAAGRYMMDLCVFNPDCDLILVHGEVTGQGPIEGVCHGHAWLEIGDEVLDVSRGREIRLPKALYYALGRIDDRDNIHRYTWQEARRKINEYEHWGPWDLETSTGY
jgi:hypothetical protein